MVEITCANCGTPLKPGAKFCATCGSATPAVASAHPATERLGVPTLVPAQPLLLLHDETGSRAVPLGSAPLRVGRAPDNDLVLPSRFVSAYHARVEASGQRHQVSDLGSTNGLLFEGQRLAANTPLLLADGDVLRIGDPTTGSFVSLTYRNPQASQTARAARLARSYPLGAREATVTIGREGNTITLDNPQVSRRHAVIERAGGRDTLRDVGSTNGTFVNGRRIERHSLQPGDVIQIGAFKLVYDGDSLDEYDQRGALRIDARNLVRTVGSGASQRTILADVSLSIAPREFIALVGGSGAGKSTLLNALSGYAPADTGQVLVNGDDFYTNFDAYRTVLGYVPQDDILHRELPVERALGYAAALRLPDDTARQEVERRIDQVLDSVDMTAHRRTLVAQLSGGQRKRVSIASELLADPSLFFLDEPSSGLDPGLEKKLMYTLRQLADSGRTVVLVTHATANIAQCDHVAFMAEGRLVYFGPPHEALAFFGVSSGDFADIYSKLAGQAEAWQQKFSTSPAYARYVAGRLAEATPEAAGSNGAASGSRRPRVARVSLFRQFGILLRRSFDLLWHDRRNLALLLLQAPLIGLLLLLVANAGAIVGPNANASEAKKLLFMLATVAVWLGIINAAREIAKEAAIYRRERLANLHIGPYLLARLLLFSPLVLLQSAMLLGMLALKVALPAWGLLLPAGVELYITTVLTSMAGVALGLAISAFASSSDRAISLVPLALIPQILFAGVIFSLGDGTTLQRLLSWFTISRWAMDGYGTSVNLNDLPLAPGLLRLRELPAEYTFTAEHLLTRWGLLLLYLLVCIALAAWLLKRRDSA